MTLSITPTSPYIYMATLSFFMTAMSSDLLFIRAALTFGFFFLVLAKMSSYSLNGSFDVSALGITRGEMDIPVMINGVLFLLNLFVCARLVNDERPKAHLLSEEEQAMYRFFHSRCGLTHLQFHEILRHGQFVELSAGAEVPHVESCLYLVLQGKVQCETSTQGSNNTMGCSSHTTKQHQDNHNHTHNNNPQSPLHFFFKRSGEFFNIKLFNIFTIPVGFDSFAFQARTVTPCRLFGWSVDGLVAMRDMQSPSLIAYWEYMVLRAMVSSAVRNHLTADETYYDSWLIPEECAWLEGAPSRDFAKPSQPVGNWLHAQRQLRILYNSLWHIIPPHGVRHRAGYNSSFGNGQRNPKQAYVELYSKAKAAQQFHFLTNDPPSQQTITATQQPYSSNNHTLQGIIPEEEIQPQTTPVTIMVDEEEGQQQQPPEHTA